MTFKTTISALALIAAAGAAQAECSKVTFSDVGLGHQTDPASAGI
jgi:hypothetical protein